MIIQGYHLFYVIGFFISLVTFLAFCRTIGIWGNLINLFNIFFATMFALNYYESLAGILDSSVPAMKYYNDMLAFLILNSLVYLVLAVVTSRISKIRVFFPKKAETSGSYALVLLLVIGFYTVPCFVFSLLTPETPQKDGTLSIPPTCAVVQYMSTGSLKPVIGTPTSFDTKELMETMTMRNKGIYVQLENDDGWKYQ